MRLRTLTLWILLPVVAAFGEERRIPERHPRLLVHRDELPALRKRCGVEAYRNAEPAAVTFAGRRGAFERVRRLADRMARDGVSPGSLYAPALAHLVLGEIGRRDPYVELVEKELAQPSSLTWRQDDRVVALDWCWDALEPKIRADIAARLAQRLEPLSDRICPWDHLVLHPRICDTATAITLHAYPWPDALAGNALKIRIMLDSAENYVGGVLVRLWQMKGPAATSPTENGWSEADAALLAELWQTGTGQPVWPLLAESLGRSMDERFWQYTGHAAAQFALPRDDGSFAPDRPGFMPESWNVAAPWLIAGRLESGVAQWFVNQFPDPPSFNAVPAERRDLLFWPQVLYGDASAAAVFRAACPLGRRVPNGFVVMRTDWSSDAAVVLADVGQPYWRSQQAYDAGHFQILRGGRLTTGSGEDVLFDATNDRGGESHLDKAEAGPDVFAQSTIAHNCITVHDPAAPVARFGRIWPARGNQRTIERNYRPTDPPIDATDRLTGRLIAFETNSFYTYAAADLSLAYPREAVRTCVRHWLLLNAGALLVCDRLAITHPSAIATWHLQLPERPTLNGRDLADDDRRHGASNAAGLWATPDTRGWIGVAGGEGRLFARTLLPEKAKQFIIGGPKQPAKIPAGRWAGQTYYGGGETGYEHRIWPASVGLGPQAWYRLGDPANLGPQFGLRSNWGRLDVAAPARSRDIVFLHLLIPVEAGTVKPPDVQVETKGSQTTTRIELPTARCEVTWQTAKLDGAGGSPAMVRIFAPKSADSLFQQALTASTEPDKPLPGERPHATQTRPATAPAKP